jgi:hypothetical protein
MEEVYKTYAGDYLGIIRKLTGLSGIMEVRVPNDILNFAEEEGLTGKVRIVPSEEPGLRFLLRCLPINPERFEEDIYKVTGIDGNVMYGNCNSSYHFYIPGSKLPIVFERANK